MLPGCMHCSTLAVSFSLFSLSCVSVLSCVTVGVTVSGVSVTLLCACVCLFVRACVCECVYVRACCVCVHARSHVPRVHVCVHSRMHFYFKKIFRKAVIYILL